MITYEANIICDKCRSKCVTGEPVDCYYEALNSAKIEAKAKGWRIECLAWASNPLAMTWTNSWCPECRKNLESK